MLKQKGSGQGSEKDHPLYLWNYLGREEGEDRFSFGALESQNAWEGFEDLYGWGLEGKRCELITTDGGNGLRNALEVVYPRIPWQHCWAHKMRNVLDKVKKADREKVKKDLHRISDAKNRQAATQAYWSFCQKYRKVYPSAVKSLESEIDDLLSFCQVKLSANKRQGLDAKEIQKAQIFFFPFLKSSYIINPKKRGFDEDEDNGFRIVHYVGHPVRMWTDGGHSQAAGTPRGSLRVTS